MKEIADYTLVRRDGDRDIIKVTCGYDYGNENSRIYESMAYEDAFKGPGVIRWAESDNCIPLDICQRMQWYDLKAQEAAIDEDTRQAIANYRKAQAEFDARTDPEAEAIRAEQAFERRAAFGPGEEVVDIFSGKRYRT